MSFTFDDRAINIDYVVTLMIYLLSSKPEYFHRGCSEKNNKWLPQPMTQSLPGSVYLDKHVYVPPIWYRRIHRWGIEKNG